MPFPMLKIPFPIPNKHRAVLILMLPEALPDPIDPIPEIKLAISKQLKPVSMRKPKVPIPFVSIPIGIKLNSMAMFKPHHPIAFIAGPRCIYFLSISKRIIIEESAFEYLSIEEGIVGDREGGREIERRGVFKRRGL